jgi:large subunit ribosomal protein L18
MFMAKGKSRIVPHRRRREGKTDYRKRLAMVKSGKLRFVVRRSNSGMLCQIVQYESKGDKTLVHADAFEIKKMGWTGPTGNIPAAYLTGMLCARRAVEKKITEAIFDMGLYRNTKGSRMFAALKGAVDGGLDIPHSEEVLPGEDRLKGAHIANGEKLAKEFDDVKKKLMK